MTAPTKRGLLLNPAATRRGALRSRLHDRPDEEGIVTYGHRIQVFLGVLRLNGRPDQEGIVVSWSEEQGTGSRYPNSVPTPHVPLACGSRGAGFRAATVAAL